MRNFLADTIHILQRHIRTTLRLPIWIVVMLVQPIIWLTLYGQLFRRVVELPGFAASSYVQFLTPGVVVMTALFGAAWSGMGLITDLDQGVMDRMLATPANRGAIIAAPVLHAALTVTIQGIIILGVGLLLGARIPGGAWGVLTVLLLSALLGAGIASLSHGVALLVRREETLIAVVNFFGLPLTFLSTAFMASALMPGWLRAITRFNPVNWAVEGARLAMAGVQLQLVGRDILSLAIFALVGSWLATQSFRLYRRSS